MIPCVRRREMREIMHQTAVFTLALLTLLFNGTANAASRNALPPGLSGQLVLHYSFDKDSGATVRDSSQKRNHGKAHGTRRSLSGKVGKCARFSKSGSYIQVPRSASLDLKRQYTLMAWVKIENTQDRQHSFILSKYDWGKGTGFGMRIERNSTIGYDFNGKNGYLSSSGAIVSDNVWTHLACSYDGKQLTGFANGKKVSSGPRQKLLNQLHDLFIGTPSNAAGNENYSFVGEIDEVMLFNTALSTDNIASIAGPSRASAPYRYTVPKRMPDGWSPGDARRARINVSLLEELVNKTRRDEYQNIHSVVVVWQDRLILDEYFNGYDANKRHTIQSVSKAVTAATVGVAIAKRRIAGTAAPAMRYLPQYADMFQGKKSNLTIEHMLAMRAGFQWAELSVPYKDPRNDCLQMNAATDCVKYLLAKPIAEDPGAVFCYNSGLTLALGEIMHKATGKTIDLYAKENIFGPLGISSFQWDKGKDGRIHTGGGLHMTPRDLAKFGSLYLNGGVWQRRRVLPAEWVQRSASWEKDDPDHKYGYHWKRDTIRAGEKAFVVFHADGYLGQFIFLVPELKLMAVFTGGNADAVLFRQPYEMMSKYIIPALPEQADKTAPNK
jgi:CubicO group peptidase (beta-lactamase class C family)